jgi:hypothetical protein
MASVIYNSFFDDLSKGAIDADTDTFKVMLVNATYDAIADETKKDSHLKRSSVTANEISGTGYTAGGTAATVGATKDTANNRVDISLGAASWASATITAEGAVYYKSRGGADTADELVAYIDFGGPISSTNGTFSLSASTIRIQN